MERSLDLALLAAALGGRTGLPTAEELQRLMADVEVELMLRQTEISQELFDAAWYLHGVASVSEARRRYTPARQRQAFLVSAHIFDLALTQDGWSRPQRLSFGFAAAIGYRRGGRDPNATAIMNRLHSTIDVESPVVAHIDTLSLEAGLAFLGFETRTLFQWLSAWRRQLNSLARATGMSDLSTTIFGPTHMVVLGAEDLLAYFTRGDTDRFERGVARLRTAALGEAGPADLNSRWVAAHLLNISGEAQAGSLWNPDVLPPTVPPLVRQAFTVGSPPVLTLWEPQRELLTGTRSPFAEDVRRMVLAVPTSGGKTLIAQMLAVEHLSRTDRSACYVAPTRSLGREVRRAMSSRVRVLQKETGAELPDYPTIWDFFEAIDTPETPPDVEVMTPERLSHLLRHDVEAVLDRFGMFVFDEAQLLKERGRGFVLESVIALLDHHTRDTSHQIVLISAAMGNAGAIAQWLSPEEGCLRHESQWRGPRRLHAAFTTKAHWAGTRIEGGAGSKWKYRHTTELSGVIRLRMANGRTAELVTEGDTGWRLVRKSKDGSTWPEEAITDQSRSTRQYVIASEMITALGHAGSVLVVAATRADAQRLAKGLAIRCDEQPSLAPLVGFVRQQLGDDHPLIDVLRRGVGYHHAGLPIEVLEALEEAVRSDVLPYLTCTSTLTDGVNLPVRTVVIYDQSYPGQPEDTRLLGARLVNAIGRAGRAGKETEGWIVLVRAAAPTEHEFRDLDPGADELAVGSSLVTDEALASLAAFEEELRANEDAIFAAAGEAADFISFVWLMLAIDESRGGDPTAVDVEGIVGSTLAAAQSQAARDAGIRIAESTRSRYVASDPDARRRWPRTGTSIGSAQTIDDVARRLTEAILGAETTDQPRDLREPLEVISMLRPLLTELLSLWEAPRWEFKVSIRGAVLAGIEPVDVLAGWISGYSLADLADTHLAAVPSAAWRIEQMVDTVTTHFEHYLAWTVGALVELVNARLAEADSDARLCPELGGYIRYGVNTAHALILMTSGIRSRRLAHAIAADLPPETQASRDELQAWLARMAIADWRHRYTTSPSETLDLLEFTRVRRRSLLKTLLETGSVAIELPKLSRPLEPDARLSLEPVVDEPDPAPLALYADTDLVGLVGSQDHADVQAILDTGLEHVLTLDEGLEESVMRISLPLRDNE